MIAVRLNGRLGNQLFQYAFICTAAKALHTGFYIDQYSERLLLHQYFCIRLSFTGRMLSRIYAIKGYKNVFSFYLRRMIYPQLEGLTGLKRRAHGDVGAAPQVILGEIYDQSIYEGYFQSAAFFKNNEPEIRRYFSVKARLKDEFRKKYTQVYKNYRVVCVHIRRTDYENLGHLNLGGADLSLPLAYYKKAMSKYAGQNVQFIFVSDDVAFVEENFKEIKNKTISTDTEIMDFQHLLNADVCIISNSTFSWWGAWLNAKPGKIVYAPKYFMGWRIQKETPADIFPDSWILVDF